MKSLKIIKKAGLQLLRLNFASRNLLKKDILALKEFRRKGVTIEEMVETVEKDCLSCRRARGKRLMSDGKSKSVNRRGTWQSHSRKPLIGGTVEQRWRRVMKKFSPVSYLAQMLDSGRTHFGTHSITWGENCKVDISVNYDSYSRGCQWKKKIHSLNVTANRNLRKAPLWVRNNAGLVALAAEEIENNLWKVTWARKTAGISCKLETGYIMRRGNETAHGMSISACKSTLSRRESENKFRKRENGILEMLQEGNCDGLGEIVVYRQNSLDAGNCQAGTDNFISEFLGGRDWATVSSLVKISREQRAFDRKTNIIAACLNAIRARKKEILQKSA